MENRIIERFMKTYKDGFEVMLNPEERDEIVEEIERLNDIIKWQQNKIAKLSSENVCLEAKIELYEDGYILDKDSDKE